MSTTTILGAVAGFVFGWLIAWLISRARISQLLVRLEERDRQLSRLGATERELGSAREELAGTRKQLEAERKSADEKLAVLRNAEQSLKEAFDALSGEALRQNTDSFLTLAASKLGDFQQASKIDLDARQKAIADLVKPIEEGSRRLMPPSRKWKICATPPISRSVIRCSRWRPRKSN